MVVGAKSMSRRFPPPWFVENIGPGTADTNSALSNHSHLIASVRILPVCAQTPVIAFPERLRVHARMQFGSRNHASRLKRWHC